VQVCPLESVQDLVQGIGQEEPVAVLQGVFAVVVFGGGKNLGAPLHPAGQLGSFFMQEL